MKATTEQLVSALRVLSVEIQSEDGVANAVIAEAADRMTLLANLVAQHVQETKEDVEQMAVASETMVEATAKIQSLRARIKRLEDGDAALTYSIGLDLQKENEALKARIKRLEEAGDRMKTWLRGDARNGSKELSALRQWRKAKEAKP